MVMVGAGLGKEKAASVLLVKRYWQTLNHQRIHGTHGVTGVNAVKRARVDSNIDIVHVKMVVNAKVKINKLFPVFSNKIVQLMVVGATGRIGGSAL